MADASVLPALLDPTRLRVAGLVSGRPLSTEHLQTELGLPKGEVLEALVVLQQAKLVESTDDGWVIPAANLRSLAASAAEAALPMDPYIGFGMRDEEREVLSRFFEGRVLVEIPASRAKRMIILERLALELDVGKRYDEDAVNELLHAFHEDYATLRRYLIDEGFLDRDAGEYWRSGGRVDV